MSQSEQAQADASKLTASRFNVKVTATNLDQVKTFYGDILGLKPLADEKLSENSIGYYGGRSEVYFFKANENASKAKGGVDSALGSRLLVFILPHDAQDRIAANFLKHGLGEPEFHRGKGLHYGMVRDYDDNQVELVFIDEGAPESTFNLFQVGLTVSSQDELQQYFKTVLGVPSLSDYTRPDGSSYPRNRLGDSVMKYWSGGRLLKPAGGLTKDVIGINVIQIEVENLEASREQLVKQGADLLASNEAGTLLVQGPDSILFEFVAA